MNDQNRSIDILGIKPVSEAISTITKATTDGAAAFLSRICLPVAEELGLLLQDKVKAWRATNAALIAAKAESKLLKSGGVGNRHGHPRIVGAIIENGSWADDDDVREMWAGLLATACTESGTSQDNLIFVNLLSQLTPSQTKTLRFACETAQKARTKNGLLTPATDFRIPLEKVVEASGTTDLHTLDLEIDRLRELGLLTLSAGLNTSPEHLALLTPSSTALHLYVRCQGFIGPPVDYFGLSGVSEESNNADFPRTVKG